MERMQPTAPAKAETARPVPKRRPPAANLRLWALFLLAGGATGFSLLVASQLKALYSLALLGMAAIIAGVVLSGRARQVLWLGFGFSLPVGIGKHFFVDYGHVGSVWGLQFTPIDVPLFWLLGMSLAESFARRRPIRMTTTSWLAVAFFLSGVPGLFIAYKPYLVFFDLFIGFKALLIYFLAAHLFDPDRDLRPVLLGVLAALFFEAALAAAQVTGAAPAWLSPLREISTEDYVEVMAGRFGRAGGTVGNSTALALFFILSLPVAVALLFAPLSRRARGLAWLAAAAGATGLLLTFSRAGWGAVVVALALVFARKRREVLSPRVLPWILLAALAGAVTLSGSEVVRTRIKEQTFDFRVRIASVALEMIKAHPFLGVGLNNFEEVMDRYETWQDVTRIGWQVHCLYLLIASEVGIVGFGFWIGWLVSGFAAARRLMRNAPTPWNHLALGIAAGLVGLLLHMLVDAGYVFSPIRYQTWFMVGLLVRAQTLLRRGELRTAVL
jgi:O-antigen ligase